MDETGNNPRNLTNSPKADNSPSWSPDKQQIVLARSSCAQGRPVPERPVDGSDRGDRPAPGGILEEREEEVVAASDICLMSISGQNLRQLTDHPADDRDPSWSPDG
jgi:Tol biopolymer transport system component